MAEIHASHGVPQCYSLVPDADILWISLYTTYTVLPISWKVAIYFEWGFPKQALTWYETCFILETLEKNAEKKRLPWSAGTSFYWLARSTYMHLFPAVHSMTSSRQFIMDRTRVGILKIDKNKWAFFSPGIQFWDIYHLATTWKRGSKGRIDKRKKESCLDLFFSITIVTQHMTESKKIFCHIPSTPIPTLQRLRNGYQSVILSRISLHTWDGASPFICLTCSSLVCDQGIIMTLWVTRY